MNDWHPFNRNQFFSSTQVITKILPQLIIGVCFESIVMKPLLSFFLLGNLNFRGIFIDLAVGRNRLLEFVDYSIVSLILLVLVVFSAAPYSKVVYNLIFSYLTAISQQQNKKKNIQIYRYVSWREISVSISCLNILNIILSKHSSSDNLNISHLSLWSVAGSAKWL